MSAMGLKLFSGSSHPELAREVAEHLGISLSEMHVSTFACGEIYAKPAVSVRADDVFILQTATSNVNEDLMELFIMLDSLKRSFAGNIHVVMPHYAYARQDRVATPREPISAKLVADLISTAGANHVIAIKLHSDQTQGFFDFPVDNVNTNKLFVDYFNEKGLRDFVVVSPDAGGAKDAKKLADLMGVNLAIIHKTRPHHNESEVTHVVGDVEGKACVIFDDMIDTGGSVIAGLGALKSMGARVDEIYLAATHPVFSGNAVEKLSQAGFREVVVTNTIPVPKSKMFDNLKVLSVAPLLAKVIDCIYSGKSVTESIY